MSDGRTASQDRPLLETATSQPPGCGTRPLGLGAPGSNGRSLAGVADAIPWGAAKPAAPTATMEIVSYRPGLIMDF
jgi:hypothetical protein